MAATSTLLQSARAPTGCATSSRQPQVKVRVGDAEFNAIARVFHNGREPQLGASVRALFDAKYGWSDSLIVELTPA
jgi:hypothetical protein